MISRDDIVSEARLYVRLQTKWRHRGRSTVGVDCVGLVIVVAEAFGIKLQDQPGYSRLPNGTLKQHLDANLISRPGASPKKGMIAVFRDGTERMHVGIVSERFGGKPYVIHATTARKKVVEEPLDARMLANLVEYYDLPGVEP